MLPGKCSATASAMHNANGYDGMASSSANTMSSADSGRPATIVVCLVKADASQPWTALAAEVQPHR